jgi:hypothetical protein
MIIGRFASTIHGDQRGMSLTQCDAAEQPAFDSRNEAKGKQTTCEFHRPRRLVGAPEREGSAHRSLSMWRSVRKEHGGISSTLKRWAIPKR